ncbi:MAG: C40 family peptidase [Chitinophagaceae bacterium]
MKYIIVVFSLFSCISFHSCSGTRASGTATVSAKNISFLPPGRSAKSILSHNINTKNVDPDLLVDFAETLVGTKYKYGSANKDQGFDCSGLITYVFTNFKIWVPRSSIDFTNSGVKINLESARRGDLILFTGTDTKGWIVGHMGIITSNEKGIVKFIHSSSGKNVGVIISLMNKYYSTRLVKVIRVF